MTSRDFCFWLQGFFEVRAPGAITEDESKMIAAHLNLVFAHEVAPTVTEPEREAHDKIHGEGHDSVDDVNAQRERVWKKLRCKRCNHTMLKHGRWPYSFRCMVQYPIYGQGWTRAPKPGMCPFHKPLVEIPICLM